MTDGVTPDAYNAVYDDVDLSGDGLTGQAKRILGINPLSQDNPLNLPALLQQSALSGVIQIPLNISTNMDADTAFTLYIDGVEANATVYQTNGNWFAQWDTIILQNGTHLASLGFPLDMAGNNAFGSATITTITNAITLDEITRWFTDQLTVNVNVNTPASKYRIEVYDAETGTHFTTLSGDISNGQIQTGWNLQDDQGNRLANGPLRCDFYLTCSQSSAQVHKLGVSPNNVSSGYPSATVNYKFIHHITGQSFTVAYGYDYFFQSKMDALQTMMLDSVVNNLDTLSDFFVDQGGGYDYDLLPTGPGGNVPYGSAWQFLNDWDSVDSLENALTSGSSANFYWWGHGNVDNIAPTSGQSKGQAPDLYAGNIQTRLHNNVREGNVNNPYRLVILDGCDGYSKLWADAFGIIYQVNGSSWTVHDYDNFGIDRQAFVAWTVETPAPSPIALTNTGIDEWGNALSILFCEWQLGYPLNVCLKDYTDTLVSYGFTSDNGFLGCWGSGTAVKQYKISGCIDLTTFDR